MFWEDVLGNTLAAFFNEKKLLKISAVLFKTNTTVEFKTNKMSKVKLLKISAVLLKKHHGGVQNKQFVATYEREILKFLDGFIPN